MFVDSRINILKKERKKITHKKYSNKAIHCASHQTDLSDFYMTEKWDLIDDLKQRFTTYNNIYFIFTFSYYLCSKKGDHIGLKN